jgi:hypothetical protein
VLGCGSGTSFDGSAGLTELYVQNDTSEALLVSFVVHEGTVAMDGSVEAQAGERTFLVQELNAGPMAPSEIIDSLQVTSLDGALVVLDLPEIDDDAWQEGEMNAYVHSEFELVVPAPGT